MHDFKHNHKAMDLPSPGAPVWIISMLEKRPKMPPWGETELGNAIRKGINYKYSFGLR